MSEYTQYINFIESVCKTYNVEQAIPLLCDGFTKFYAAANPQCEGMFGDVMKKAGKAAAIGALAFGAANAEAAPKHKAPTQPHSKPTTIVTSSTHHNLWKNQQYQDRTMEIFNQMVAERKAQGKPINEQILYSKAQMKAMAELNK